VVAAGCAGMAVGSMSGNRFGLAVPDGQNPRSLSGAVNFIRDNELGFSVNRFRTQRISSGAARDDCSGRGIFKNRLWLDYRNTLIL